MRRDRCALTLGLLFSLALVTLGCNNDSGTSGTPCLEFSPATIPDPLSVTATEGQGSDCDFAVVELVVTDVSNLYAVSLDVKFDATRVNLSSVSTTNSVLTSDGAPLLRQVTPIASGQVHVAITRSQVTTGVNVVGGGSLATITFVRTGNSGMSTLTFTDADLLDPGTPPLPLPGISFHGGSFNIFEN